MKKQHCKPSIPRFGRVFDSGYAQWIIFDRERAASPAEERWEKPVAHVCRGPYAEVMLAALNEADVRGQLK